MIVPSQRARTGTVMRRFSAPIVLALLAAFPLPAAATDLPAIKAGGRNVVPECVTPGRLQAFLKARNPNIDGRYETIATEYMRHGEDLGIRWDYAFWQMIVETGALSYKNGSKPGDVRPSQNNFAGLGATGKGERGESFKDLATGVRAHLQHLLMYSGEKVADPVAERTRKVQEWGVLTSWHAKFNRPITFADMAKQWAPGSRGYAGMLSDIAEQFDDAYCSKPDPRPELVQEARGGAASGAGKAETRVTDSKAARGATKPDKSEKRDEIAEKITGAEIFRRKVEEERAETTTSGYKGLGASSIIPKDAVAIQQPTTILNAPKSEPAESAPSVQTASATAAVAGAKAAAAPPPAASNKCSVFTASYGGQKAVIIKAAAPEGTQYTVLDVNEGAEKRETEAFIQAYAKGGQLVGEFISSNMALDKAFELCPEG
jgi:hypothetical protein